MRIKSLKLTNFRNHKDRTFEFSKNTTLIIGHNGAGKTNILEAIYLLSTGKSNRAVYERDLVFINENFARVELTVNDNLETENQLEIQPENVKPSNNDIVELTLSKKENNRVNKVFKINGVTKSTTNAVHFYDVVSFAPEDIRIVAGSPSRRREYLDKIIGSVDKVYRTYLSTYEKVLRQRNIVLEEIGLKDLYLNEQNVRHDLEYWDLKLVEAAFYIQTKRSKFFEFAANKLPKISKDLFANGILNLEYHQNILNKEKLAANLRLDIMKKNTSMGPHRDDYEFKLDLVYKPSKTNTSDGADEVYGSTLDEFLGLVDEKHKEFTLDLKSFGSRGQQRTAVLALKVLEMLYINEIKNTDPILLLDDIFSELDEDYRRLVLNITKNKQTIITSAVDVESLVKDEVKIIRL